jgi:hypothetical protein
VLRLECGEQIDGDADLVDLVEVVDGEALLRQVDALGHGDVLWHDLIDLLGDDSSHLAVLDASHAAPLVGVAVAGHTEPLEPVQDGLLVDALDVALDPAIRGRDDLDRIERDVAEDLVWAHSHHDAALRRGVAVRDEHL